MRSLLPAIIIWKLLILSTVRSFPGSEICRNFLDDGKAGPHDCKLVSRAFVAPEPHPVTGGEDHQGIGGGDGAAAGSSRTGSGAGTGGHDATSGDSSMTGSLTEGSETRVDTTPEGETRVNSGAEGDEQQTGPSKSSNGDDATSPVTAPDAPGPSVESPLPGSDVAVVDLGPVKDPNSKDPLPADIPSCFMRRAFLLFKRMPRNCPTTLAYRPVSSDSDPTAYKGIGSNQGKRYKVERNDNGRAFLYYLGGDMKYHLDTSSVSNLVKGTNAEGVAFKRDGQNYVFVRDDASDTPGIGSLYNADRLIKAAQQAEQRRLREEAAASQRGKARAEESESSPGVSSADESDWSGNEPKAAPAKSRWTPEMERLRAQRQKGAASDVRSDAERRADYKRNAYKLDTYAFDPAQAKKNFAREQKIYSGNYKTTKITRAGANVLNSGQTKDTYEFHRRLSNPELSGASDSEWSTYETASKLPGKSKYNDDPTIQVKQHMTDRATDIVNMQRFAKYDTMRNIVDKHGNVIGMRPAAKDESIPVYAQGMHRVVETSRAANPKIRDQDIGGNVRRSGGVNVVNQDTLSTIDDSVREMGGSLYDTTRFSRDSADPASRRGFKRLVGTPNMRGIVEEMHRYPQYHPDDQYLTDIDVRGDTQGLKGGGPAAISGVMKRDKKKKKKKKKWFSFRKRAVNIGGGGGGFANVTMGVAGLRPRNDTAAGVNAYDAWFELYDWDGDWEWEY